MKTKILLVCLIVLAQALKTKAENKLIFSSYKDNKYIVLDAKEERCGPIVGHKILDTVLISNSIFSDDLKEKCYLNPNQNFLIWESTYYIYERAFSFSTKIDSNYYAVRQGKSIRILSILMSKSDRKFNWLFPFLIVIIIFFGYVTSEKIREYCHIKNLHRPYFRYFLDGRIKNDWRNYGITSIVILFLKFIALSILFSSLFVSISLGLGAVHHFPVTSFLHLTILAIPLFFFSYLITSLIKIIKEKGKIKVEN